MMTEFTETEDQVDESVEETLQEVREMVEARRELLSCELQLDAATCKSLAIKLFIAIVMVAAGAAMLLTLLASWLDEHLPVDQLPRWTVVIGCTLLAVGGLLLISALKRFAHDFLGLRNTIAELEEDAVWISETLQERFGS